MQHSTATCNQSLVRHRLHRSANQTRNSTCLQQHSGHNHNQHRNDVKGPHTVLVGDVGLTSTSFAQPSSEIALLEYHTVSACDGNMRVSSSARSPRAHHRSNQVQVTFRGEVKLLTTFSGLESMLTHDHNSAVQVQQLQSYPSTRQSIGSTYNSSGYAANS